MLLDDSLQVQSLTPIQSKHEASIVFWHYTAPAFCEYKGSLNFMYVNSQGLVFCTLSQKLLQERNPQAIVDTILQQSKLLFPLKTQSIYAEFVVSLDGSKVAIKSDYTFVIDRNKIVESTIDNFYHVKVLPKSILFFWSPNSRYLVIFSKSQKWTCYDSWTEQSFDIGKPLFGYILFSSQFSFIYTYFERKQIVGIAQFFPQYANNTNFFSPDSSKFVVCDQNGNVCIVPLTPNSECRVIASGAASASWSPT